MTDKENLYDFLKNILVFDPRTRFTPVKALQHPFITSAMGNMTVRPSLHHSTTTEPHIQKPVAMPQISKSTGSITSEMIYASLAKAVASSSSLNTSRTTEESIDILTPNNSQINLQQQQQQQLKQGSLSPQHITIVAPDAATKTVASAPFKSILKTKKVPSKSNTPITLVPSLSSPIRGQQENTLDRKVTFLQQSRPNSTSQLSDQTVVKQPSAVVVAAVADDPIPNIVNTSMYNQNYIAQQQHPYITQYNQQQWMAYLAQHNVTNAATSQTIAAPTTYALSPSYTTNANLPYIYQQAQVMRQQIMNPTYSAYPYHHPPQQQPYLLPQQKQPQPQQHPSHLCWSLYSTSM